MQMPIVNFKTVNEVVHELNSKFDNKINVSFTSFYTGHQGQTYLTLHLDKPLNSKIILPVNEEKNFQARLRDSILKEANKLL